jgi:hypothetical protein
VTYPLRPHREHQLRDAVESVREPQVERIMAIFKFFCDESHDSTNQKRKPGDPPFEPKSYVVSGFFAEEDVWSKIEREWKRRNELEGVLRFHAAHLNAGTREYDGWSKNRRLTYSKEILRILKRQHRKLHGMSVGMFVDEYRRLISPEGQIKLGHPYLVCFKSVIAVVAEQMDYAGYAQSDRFSAIIDRCEFETEAVKAFYGMKDNSMFKYGHRLADCISGDAEEFIGLQPADFLAYETFRLMHGKRKGVTKMRAALGTMLGTNGFLGYAFEEESLNRIKEAVDTMPSVPNGFVVIPPYIED